MKIYLDFASARHHPLYDELILYPPDGIEYQISSGKIYSTSAHGVFNFFYNHPLLRKLKPLLRKIYSGAVNTYINKISKEDKNVALVHVCNTFVASRNRPRVIDIECIGPSTTGSDIHGFRFQKKKIEKTLSSKYCKKIMPWTNMGRKSLEAFLNVKNFEDKIEVVYPAMHSVPRQPKREEGKIKILFVGSIFNPKAFVYKGGEYALKCFEILSKKYDVELIIRSTVPYEIENKYAGLQDLIFIKDPLPKDKLFDLFSNSNISLLPGHVYPLMATLESMAFGLPVVTIDGVANSEFVEHGKTGFLAKPSKYIPVRDWIFFGWMREYKERRRIIDPKVVDDLTKYLTILIEDDSLRKEMGARARKRIESGNFSIGVRNQKLKRIYEEAARK